MLLSLNTMWKTAIGSAIKSQQVLLTAENILHEQLRTTFIVKRKFPTQLHKKGDPPKVLRSRHYVYDLVKDTQSDKQPNIDVILTSYVDGLGNVGDRVTVKSNYAYNNLLLPGLAVYPSPENTERFKDKEQKDVKRYSSANAILTAKALSTMTLSVVMNSETPWVLKPWHIKTSFRKCCYVVPEEAITLPEKPIKGPDISLEDKEFFITVTINNAEKVNVRCRIHHWRTDVTERIPYTFEFWKNTSEPLFEEQAAVLQKLPKKGEKISSERLNELIF